MKKQVFFVILCCAGFFLLLHLGPAVPDGDDAYRHAAFAHLIATDWNDVKSNGWHLLYLWPKPVDVWFLFHLLLAPLTLVLAPLDAIKLLSTLLLAAILLAFYRLLEHLGVRHRIFWSAFLLFGSAAFLLRLTTCRPLALSVLLLLAAADSALKKRNLLLALCSALYALAYPLYFLVLAVPGAVFLVRRSRENLVLVLDSLIGVAAGIVVNPFFPENFRFALTALAAQAWYAPQLHLIVGQELAPMNSFVFGNLVFVLTAWILAIAAYFKERRARLASPANSFLFVLSVFFFLLAFKSQRFVECCLPFGVLFAASQLDPYLRLVITWARKQSIPRRFLYAPLVAVFLPVAFYNLHLNFVAARLTPPPQAKLGAAQYLLQHSAKGEIVFNAQFQDYWTLFLWDQRNNYVTGIDPVIMYILDKDRYWLWRHISDDELLTCAAEDCTANFKTDKKIYDAVKNDFRASYVFLESTRNPILKNYLDKAAGFQLVYNDDKNSLYKVR